MVFAFVQPSQVEIVDTWYVKALRASGTQDLDIDDVFVPDEMAGLAFMGPAGLGLHLLREAPIGRIPFMSLAGLAQVPPVSLGIARRAIDEFRQLALTKQSAFGGPRLAEDGQAQAGLAKAEGLLRSARGYWYGEVQGL